MNRIVMTSRVDGDGVLRLVLPVGIAEAGKDLSITVQSPPAPTATSAEQWAAWVDSMAGSWQGDYERPPQDLLNGP